MLLKNNIDKYLEEIEKKEKESKEIQEIFYQDSHRNPPYRSKKPRHE